MSPTSLAPGRSAVKSRPISELGADALRREGLIDALILTKTSARSTVHRPGYMDYIGILGYDDAGNVVSEQRFLGLYTSSAYTRRPWDIPLVRERFEHAQLRGDHDGACVDGRIRLEHRDGHHPRGQDGRLDWVLRHQSNAHPSASSSARD